MRVGEDDLLMNQTDKQVFKNDNLRRLLYFISIFFFIPVGLEIFMQGMSGEYILTIDAIPIPQQLSSILLMLIGIVAVIGWPIYAVDTLLYSIIFNQNDIQKKDLLSILSGKNDVINFQGIHKIVPYRKRKAFNKVVLYLSNGQDVTLKISNMSKQNRSDVISILKSHAR